MVPAALVAVLALSGCAGQGGTSAASPTATAPSATASPTVPPNVTASPRPTETIAPTTPATGAPPATTAPPAPVVDAFDTVVEACTAWQQSLAQDAATFPATQARAAQLAATAAAADPTWQTVASDMAGLVAIGTDTSSDAVAKGQELFTDLSTQCGSAGVTVSAG